LYFLGKALKWLGNRALLVRIELFNTHFGGIADIRSLQKNYIWNVSKTFYLKIAETVAYVFVW